MVDSDIKVNIISQTQFIFTMLNGLKCSRVKINFSDLCISNVMYMLCICYVMAHEKFDVCNKVAPQSKFPCGPLNLNSRVHPN